MVFGDWVETFFNAYRKNGDVVESGGAERRVDG